MLDGLDAVRAAVGSHLGYSDWIEVTQEQVNLFADATGDHQWIHVDVERAKAESPFGGPIAHGYLTLALTNLFLPQLVEVRGVSMGVNYGTGKVRFPSPVPVGSPRAGRRRAGGRRGHPRRRPDDDASSPSRSRARTSRPAWSSASAAGWPEQIASDACIARQGRDSG